MALSKVELDQIHLRKLATPGRKYYGDDEKVYIGTSDRRLKLFSNSSEVLYKNINTSGTTVKDSLNNIVEKITNTDIVEIDFGGIPGGNYTELTVNNFLIKTNSIVILKVPSKSTLDHNEVEHSIIPLNLTFGDIIDGASFKIKAFTDLRITGKINIQYLIL